MIPKFLSSSNLPRKPGVYIFKDRAGKVLYIGKAIDLYHRIASYFSGLHRGWVRTSTMVDSMAKVETIVVESELEALILEANLIKKYLPQFNIKLTDDKDYLYIAVTKEDFPKILSARKKDLPAGRQVSRLVKKYWGPFPSSKTVRDTLKALRKVFPWCSTASKGSTFKVRPSFLDNGVTLEPTSSRGHEVIAKTRFRPCFYYHLGLCPGACLGLISQKDYNTIISHFSKLLDGRKDELVTQLTDEMMKESIEQRFEEAAKIKKILEGISYLTQPNRTRLYLENPNFLQEENQLALEQLKTDLSLNKLPKRIEGYDISNIQGKFAAGSMVVLTSGEVDKSQYRKFKIIISGKPNDVGMMREMIRRRFKHTEWPLPELIIVDGGKAQARAAKFQISNFKFQIPVFGLAKKREWLYPPEGQVLRLSRKSLSLKLLQKLRDEAHRFALSYHKKLRDRIL